jgi:hypothetical protein
MPIYINGEVANIPLVQLIAEGKEIAEREGLQPKTQGVSLDLWAASIAVSRYDEAHRRWFEAHEDEQMRTLRSQAQENVRMLKASVEAKRTN